MRRWPKVIRWLTKARAPDRESPLTLSTSQPSIWRSITTVGNVAIKQPGEISGFGAEGRDEDSIDALADDHVQVALLLGCVFIGVAQEHRVAAALGRVLHAARNSGPEGVLDVGHDQRQGAGSFGAQALGDAAGHVAQVLDSLFDALLGGCVDVADAIDHPRHGYGRDASSFSDIADRAHGRPGAKTGQQKPQRKGEGK